MQPLCRQNLRCGRLIFKLIEVLQHRRSGAHLQILGGIARQLQHLGRQVLCVGKV